MELTLGAPSPPPSCVLPVCPQIFGCGIAGSQIWKAPTDRCCTPWLAKPSPPHLPWSALPISPPLVPRGRYAVVGRPLIEEATGRRMLPTLDGGATSLFTGQEVPPVHTSFRIGGEASGEVAGGHAGGGAQQAEAMAGADVEDGRARRGVARRSKRRRS